jgi:hypothetical protein
VTTATPSKPIPTHYQDVISKAQAMGWDVERNPSSVKVVPPKGSKIKPFSLSRTTPLVPPQLANTLEKNGFSSAYQDWLKNEGKRETKPEPKATAATKPEKEVRVCPECVEQGVETPFSTTHPPALGVHRRSKHGVAGSSPEAVRKRGVTAAKKGAAKKTAKKAPAAKKTAPAPVPAPRTAVPVPAKQEPLINISGLPVSVAAPLGELLNAISATSGDAEDLQKEVEMLRDFRDQVEAEVSDANKPPVLVVASIHSLVTEIKQK